MLLGYIDLANTSGEAHLAKKMFMKGLLVYTTEEIRGGHINC